MVSYYVVAIERDDPMLDKFHFIGSTLLEESIARIRTKLLRTGDSSFLKELGQVETYTFGVVSPGYEHRIPEWLKNYVPTPEYKSFNKVYFLNDLALRMYREGGVEFEVYKVLADQELPEGCTKCHSAPYLAKEE